MASSFLDALKGINAYPIPLRTLVETAARRGISLDSEVSQEGLQVREYRLAKADLLLWLSIAPDISQGGQSYSFTDVQRQQMRNEANAIYRELEPQGTAGSVVFGYKGDRL